MHEATLMWYETFIISIYEHVKYNFIEYDQDSEIVVKNAKLSNDAKLEWQRIFNDITNVQNSDDENEYMKSMLPKQKSYIPRFALLIHVLDYFMDTNSKDPYIVNKDAMLKAEKLSKYFIQMAKKVKVNSIEHKEIKDVIFNAKNKTNKEKFLEMYTANPELDKKRVAEILGISLQMVYNYIKEFKK
jgi:predicted transcriptional regulator